MERVEWVEASGSYYNGSEVDGPTGYHGTYLEYEIRLLF